MSARRILVTRAQPGAQETAARLEAMGYEAMVSPAITLEALPDTPLPETSDLAGLVFTSANGVLHFCQRSKDRSLPAWCVGPATAQAARTAGFVEVRNAMGDADRLAAFIEANAAPEDGQLLHVANSAAAGQLAERLRQAGFTVAFAPLYTPSPARALSAQAAEALGRGHVCAVLFHSAKGAAAFAKLVSLAEFDLRGAHGIGVSQKALDPVTDLDWAGLTPAQFPNETALMAALQRVLTPA